MGRAYRLFGNLHGAGLRVGAGIGGQAVTRKQMAVEVAGFVSLVALFYLVYVLS